MVYEGHGTVSGEHGIRASGRGSLMGDELRWVSGVKMLQWAVSVYEILARRHMIVSIIRALCCPENRGSKYSSVKELL